MLVVLAAFLTRDLVGRTRYVLLTGSVGGILSLLFCSKMLFYQLSWWEFSNFGTIRLTEPLPVRDLLFLALEKYAAA